MQEICLGLASEGGFLFDEEPGLFWPTDVDTFASPVVYPFVCVVAGVAWDF